MKKNESDESVLFLKIETTADITEVGGADIFLDRFLSCYPIICSHPPFFWEQHIPFSYHLLHQPLYDSSFLNFAVRVFP